MKTLILLTATPPLALLATIPAMAVALPVAMAGQTAYFAAVTILAVAGGFWGALKSLEI